jgi:predicted amidohydrolase
MTAGRTNLVPNPDFSAGVAGGLPEGWQVKGPRPSLLPRFELTAGESGNTLKISGAGEPNGLGCICASVALTGGRTYRMSVAFNITEDLNPHRNLLFAFYTSEGANNGIFEFVRREDGWIEGENRFFLPGEGELTGELSIHFRLSAGGTAWVKHVAFEPCDPVPQRPVCVACVEGEAPMDVWERVLDAAGRRSVDLVLLPENFYSRDYQATEPPDGPSVSLMSRKARQYGMYVAGTFFHEDAAAGYVYNTGLLLNRQGEVAGRYDKNHPFSPELLTGGISPGSDVPVFETDFGKVGMMICYDSWFTDVAELLALQGAEILLFPNTGYYQSLMPARAADNCVRIITSSLESPLGIWDTSGAEVRSPNADPTRHANNDATFGEVVEEEVDGVKMLFAVLDLSQSPSPHNWGGPLKSAPGGRRNRREQKELLLDRIKAEINRW